MLDVMSKDSASTVPAFGEVSLRQRQNLGIELFGTKTIPFVCKYELPCPSSKTHSVSHTEQFVIRQCFFTCSDDAKSDVVI